MIFIAGVSPKIKVLNQNPRRCPVCGLHQAYAKRMDHYLSLFFIPIIRVKKGEPFLACDRCEQIAHAPGPDFNRQAYEEAKACRYCGQTLDKDFKYCPQCGKRV
ncbi:MAG: zinc ribbon domain-containing protein [Deltaproteobacteria bacterium]|jgi:RNA polymerase subunit RPABC4/transcription elongation factor Spt4|nr:zinc ribbon domain-containing protein [Deltaproteobacteria bacterium]